MDLKHAQLPTTTRPSQQSTTRLRALFLGAFVFALCARHHLSSLWAHETRHGAEPACPQVDALVPSDNARILRLLDAKYDDPRFTEESALILGGAVRIATESYDDQPPVGKDPRWDAFAPLHDYLLATFPQLHATLALTKVNTYGLVYHWQGSDASLKPLLITDVVPVEPDTTDKWTHAPYSGHFDGEWIWGRGAVDDKSTLISSLSAVEHLIAFGFEPKRTVVFAFGFDEESSGEQGALQLSHFLEKTYGPKSFAMLVDEGDSMEERNATILSKPAVTEKGYFDAHVTVHTAGGHSSVPPSHTGIGILSSAIVALEAHPPTPRLTRTHPAYAALLCAAQHVPGSFSDSLRADILDGRESDKALQRAEKALLRDPVQRALLGTSQAVDIVRGGVKVNALPELANVVVNYRVDAQSSVGELKTHLRRVLKPVAHNFNLSFSAFDEESVAGPDSKLVVWDAWHSALEPAPHTPVDAEAKPFALLSGTIKAVVQHNPNVEPANVVVAPTIGSGNTDTSRYWNLTDHIFRYLHVKEDDMQNEHTVDEALRASALVEYIRFFTYLILNADEAALD
ncbi:carboxypeptidase S [Exidia glandulosa HHB12029]|uniref:Carboxypeptidase S n=1 Tax=Exidia glandulosa HHB12029 TaxID=1314781 RepID=A0A165N0R1_EXIGL|nr:carboxypeptidase S [Exidia glandulosa HHB12029]